MVEDPRVLIKLESSMDGCMKATLKTSNGMLFLEFQVVQSIAVPFQSGIRQMAWQCLSGFLTSG